MDRIRRDMLQLREANGIYIAHENWRYVFNYLFSKEFVII